LYSNPWRPGFSTKMATKTTSPILEDVQKNSFPVSYSTLHTTDLVYSFYPSCSVGSSIRIPAFQDMYTNWQNFLRARCPQNDPTFCICHSCYMDITDFIESYYFIYAQTTKMCQHQDCVCLHKTFSMSKIFHVLAYVSDGARLALVGEYISVGWRETKCLARNCLSWCVMTCIPLIPIMTCLVDKLW